MDGVVFEPTKIKLNTLQINKTVNDIWILHPQNTILSLDYFIYTNRVKKVTFDMSTVMNIVNIGNVRSEVNIGNDVNEVKEGNIIGNEGNGRNKVVNNGNDAKVASTSDSPNKIESSIIGRLDINFIIK